MIPRFVLVGCGRIARRHAIQINRIGILAGVCDPNPEILAGFRKEFSVPAFETPQELFSGTMADVAVICSPNGLHAHHAQLALSHGLHVLCEKPVLINPDQAAPLRQAIQDSGKMFFSVLSARFHPVIRQLRSTLSSGDLGNVLSFSLSASWNRQADYFQKSSWKGKAELDGGILFTQFSHYIDAMCWCLGEIHPLAVQTANFLHAGIIDQEDTGVAILQTGQGALGNLHWSVNSYRRNLEISWLILTEKGSFKIGGEYLQKLEYECSVNSEKKLAAEIPQPSANADHSHHYQIYDELIKALHGTPHLLPDLQEALASIQLIREIYQLSGKQGKP